MALWGRVDSKVVPGTVAVVEYDPEANDGAGNELAARTVTGTGTAFTTVNVTAGSFVATRTYTIVSVGTTDFTAIGASANQVGVTFVAYGVGTGTGVASTGLKNGQTLLIGSPAVPYKIGNIASATSLTLTKPYLGATDSGLTVTANESPAFANGARPYPSQPYGVSATEQGVGADQILSVTLLGGGTGYVEEPVPTITSEDGTGATFDVTISGGAVTVIAITDAGSGYVAGDSITIPKARVTVPTTSIAADTDVFGYDAHGFAAGEAVKYYDGGGTAVAGLTDEASYFISAIGLTVDEFRLATSALLAAGNGNLATVAISGTGGEFTCAADTLAVDDRVQISGTLTGDGAITGYTTGKVYKVYEVTGSSPNVTGFTLTEEDGTAVVTTAGTTTGLTFLTGTIVLITGTGYNAQYFEKTSKTAATAGIVFGPGLDLVGVDTGGGASTAVSAPGWVVVRTGTGGRAGRRTYETLAVVRGIKNDASDDTVFPDA